MPITSAEKGSEVLWKLYEKYPSIQKEYGPIQPLVLHTTSPNFLITSKKQVKTLDDLKGLKIRTLGGPPIEMAKALGALAGRVADARHVSGARQGRIRRRGGSVGGGPCLPAL